MARAALRIEVSTKDRKELRKLLSGGVQQVRLALRAVALLQLARGVSAPRIAGMVPLTAQAIRKIGHRYQEGGLERALYEKQRHGAEALLEHQLEIRPPSRPAQVWLRERAQAGSSITEKSRPGHLLAVLRAVMIHNAGLLTAPEPTPHVQHP